MYPENSREYRKLIYLTPHNICKPTAMSNRTIAIVNSLNEKGVSVSIDCLALENKNDKLPEDIHKDIQINFYAKSSGLNMLAHVVSLFRYFFKIIRYQDAIIYVYGYNMIIEILLLLVRPIKKLRIIHELTEYPGYNKEPGKFAGKLLSASLRNSFLVVVISNALKRYVEKYTKSPTIVLNMVVDAKRFKDQVQSRRNIISYCGNLYGDKDGLYNLILSFSIFKKKVGENYTLRLIGDISDKDQIAPLMDLCKRENIEKSVELTGKIDRDKIPIMLSDSKLLALCRPNNRQAEGGFPTKLGEYLATGLPTLTTKVGEIGNFIRDGINGFLADSNDPDVFANKMVEILSNYDRSAKIGQKGKKLVETVFSAPEEVKKLLPYLV